MRALANGLAAGLVVAGLTLGVLAVLGAAQQLAAWWRRVRPVQWRTRP